ncbi:hypothetical protein E4U52_003600 [Claviceps spartinae]|nr:hypothetical protein E4U52_003600 [Claviceps spartinae]
MNSTLYIHVTFTSMPPPIAAAAAVAVLVRALHIAGNSHGQHYVTDSPLNVYLRRTLSPGLYPQLQTYTAAAKSSKRSVLMTTRSFAGAISSSVQLD